MQKIISFPHLGDYYIPISLFLKRTTKQKVVPAPKITKKTLELGLKNSPESVCIPFKYNLGNFIESLENGANVLFTAGGGCRYRYYAEVSEEILRDLGYNFEFYKLISGDSLSIKEVYKIFKKLNNKLKFRTFIHNAIFTIFYIYYMDKIDVIIRKNIGFEKEKNSHIKLKKKMFYEFSKTKSITKLTILYLKYRHRFKKIRLNNKTGCLKVGIIGELYTSMEPYSNYFLEEYLAKENIEIKRFTNLSYLLWQKKYLKHHMLRTTKKYCKYPMGADGLDNIYRCIKLKRKKYDGIIHIKPFGCTPEIGAIPIMQKYCSDNEIPIIFFSYDSENSMEGIRNRLEAFKDLLEIRRDKID